MLKKLSFLCLFLLMFAPAAQAAEVAGDLLIDLDINRDYTATDVGQVESITQTGSIDGSFGHVYGEQFVIESEPMLNDNEFLIIHDLNLDDAYALVNGEGEMIPAPEDMRDDSWTVEVWLREERWDNFPSFFGWGDNNGSGGAAFCFGGHTTFDNRPNKRWTGSWDNSNYFLWNHLVITWNEDENLLKAYQNGAVKKQESSPNIPMPIAENFPMVLGSRSNNTPLPATAFNTGAWRFSGWIARLRVHSEALTDAQVLDNYNEEREDFVSSFLIVTNPVPVNPVLDFGQISSADLPAEQMVTIRNEGDTLIDLTGFEITEDEGGAFYITDPGSLPETLDAGEEASFGVSFDPAQTGVLSETLTITADCALCETVIELTGELLPSLQVLDPASLELEYGQVDFSNLPINAAVTIRNRSDAAFNLTSFEITGDDFQFPDDQTLPESLAGEEESTFIVQFNPSEKGPKSGTLTITGDCLDCTQVVNLTANAQDGLLDIVSPISGQLECGHADPGETGPARKVLIENTGAGTLTFSSIAISGEDAGEFEVTADLSPLGPAKQRVIEVAYAPTAAATDEVTAQLDIATNEDGTQSVDLVSNVPILYVATTGDDGNDGSQANPFATIQHAIDVAGSPGVIEVADGTYPAFTFADTINNVRIYAENPGNVDLDMEGSVINILNTEGINVIRIEGFNIEKTDTHGDPETTDNTLGIINVDSAGMKSLILDNCHLEGDGDWNGTTLVGINEFAGSASGEATVDILNCTMLDHRPHPSPGGVYSQRFCVMWWAGGDAPGRLNVENCTSVGHRGQVLHMANRNIDFVVKGCHFETTLHNSVHITSAESCTITESTFVDSERFLIEGYYYTFCDDGYVIDRCLFSQSINSGDMIFLNDRSGDKLISNCIFEGLCGNAIHMGAGPGGADGIADGIGGLQNVVNCTLIAADGASNGINLGARGVANIDSNIINTICLGFSTNVNNPDDVLLNVENSLITPDSGDPKLTFQGGDDAQDTIPRDPDDLTADFTEYMPTEDSVDVIGLGVPYDPYTRNYTNTGNGVPVDIHNMDYAGNQWGDPPSIGALEFADVTGVPVFTGDANCDGQINIVDVISILGHLFSQQPACCAPNMDINGDNQLNIVDGVNLLGFQFSQGTMTAPDGTTLGADDTGCIMYDQADIPPVGGCDNPCAP